MFATVMSGKIYPKSCIGASRRAWILANLQHGDRARVANLVGTSVGYVKDVFLRRPTAKSVLAERIWLAAYKYLKLRDELAAEMQASQE